MATPTQSTELRSEHSPFHLELGETRPKIPLQVHLADVISRFHIVVSPAIITQPFEDLGGDH